MKITIGHDKEKEILLELTKDAVQYRLVTLNRYEAALQQIEARRNIIRNLEITDIIDRLNLKNKYNIKDSEKAKELHRRLLKLENDFFLDNYNIEKTNIKSENDYKKELESYKKLFKSYLKDLKFNFGLLYKYLSLVNFVGRLYNLIEEMEKEEGYTKEVENIEDVELPKLEKEKDLLEIRVFRDLIEKNNISLFVEVQENKIKC